MADITKCQGKTCNKKHTCYRYTVEDTPHWQSYFAEDPNKTPDECEMYWKCEELNVQGQEKNESKQKECYIVEKRKQHREKISKLRIDLQEELESECEKLTGHKFSEWVYKPVYNIFQEAIHTHYRVCALCWKKEYKKKYEETRVDNSLKWEVCATAMPKFGNT